MNSSEKEKSIESTNHIYGTDYKKQTSPRYMSQEFYKNTIKQPYNPLKNYKSVDDKDYINVATKSGQSTKRNFQPSS